MMEFRELELKSVVIDPWCTEMNGGDERLQTYNGGGHHQIYSRRLPTPALPFTHVASVCWRGGIWPNDGCGGRTCW